MLVGTLFWKQICKVRTNLGATFQGFRGRLHSVVPGVVATPCVFQYVRQIFPKLRDVLDVYGAWKWYRLHYGMDEQGRFQQRAMTSDKEDKGKNVEEQGGQTRFESKRKLAWFMNQIASGKHDQAFTRMARRTSSSTNLDLGCEGMRTAQKQVS